MKALYIAAIDQFNPLDFGVYNKIEGQINAFKKLDVDISWVLIRGGDLWYNNQLLYRNISRPVHINFFRVIIKHLDQLIQKYDFVYIRYARGNIFYYLLLKRLKERGIRVITEIPTFPYDSEFDNNPKQLLYRTIDGYITKRMHKYVYRIATTNNYNFIFNIPTIKIKNAVNLEKIKLRKGEIKKNTYNLIGVANLAKWHGYDRIIRGLKEYYDSNLDKVDVNFFIVGEGNEKQNLLELVKNLNLEDRVKFLGAQTGGELDNLFNNANIGVSSLALNRAGGGHDPIKTKEFIARGMPVVLGYEDKLIDMNLSYVIRFDDDESPININYLVNKVREINSTPMEIRSYALSNLVWEKQMLKVINSL